MQQQIRRWQRSSFAFSYLDDLTYHSTALWTSSWPSPPWSFHLKCLPLSFSSALPTLPLSSRICSLRPPNHLPFLLTFRQVIPSHLVKCSVSFKSSAMWDYYDLWLPNRLMNFTCLSNYQVKRFLLLLGIAFLARGTFWELRKRYRDDPWIDSHLRLKCINQPQNYYQEPWKWSKSSPDSRVLLNVKATTFSYSLKEKKFSLKLKPAKCKHKLKRSLMYNQRGTLVQEDPAFLQSRTQHIY